MNFLPSLSKTAGAEEDRGRKVPPRFPKLQQRNDINIPKKQKNVFTTFRPCVNIYVGGGWDFPVSPRVFNHDPCFGSWSKNIRTSRPPDASTQIPSTEVTYKWLKKFSLWRPCCVTQISLSSQPACLTTSLLPCWRPSIRPAIL